MARLVGSTETQLALHVALVQGRAQTAVGLVNGGGRVDPEGPALGRVVRVEVDRVGRGVGLGGRGEAKEAKFTAGGVAVAAGEEVVV